MNRVVDFGRFCPKNDFLCFINDDDYDCYYICIFLVKLFMHDEELTDIKETNASAAGVM